MGLLRGAMFGFVFVAGAMAAPLLGRVNLAAIHYKAVIDGRSCGVFMLVPAERAELKRVFTLLDDVEGSEDQP